MLENPIFGVKNDAKRTFFRGNIVPSPGRYATRKPPSENMECGKFRSLHTSMKARKFTDLNLSVLVQENFATDESAMIK